MPRYALKIEYHGQGFYGWQRQNDLPTVTVQSALEQALAQLEPDLPSIAAAGRTDTGVHGLGQVAHCDMRKAWDPIKLKGALNYHLKPNRIAVLDCRQVDPDWHARFSAIGRDYLFRLVCRAAPVTHDAGLVWQSRHPLDADAMRAGAHDYHEGQEIRFHVKARSFLHNQVRSLVGTLERVGAGAWPPERVAEALAACDRAACGPVCPPFN